MSRILNRKCLLRRRREYSGQRLSRLCRKIHPLTYRMTVLTLAPEDGLHKKNITAIRLELLTDLCTKNWAAWVKSVDGARLKQVQILLKHPTHQNIDLMMDLERLLQQLKQVC